VYLSGNVICVVFQIETKRQKALQQSQDDSLDAQANRRGSSDAAGDWDFTARTGQLSDCNSRPHSRSHSRIDSFSFGGDGGSSSYDNDPMRGMQMGGAAASGSSGLGSSHSSTNLNGMAAGGSNSKSGGEDAAGERGKEKVAMRPLDLGLLINTDARDGKHQQKQQQDAGSQKNGGGLQGDWGGGLGGSSSSDYDESLVTPRALHTNSSMSSDQDHRYSKELARGVLVPSASSSTRSAGLPAAGHEQVFFPTTYAPNSKYSSSKGVGVGGGYSPSQDLQQSKHSSSQLTPPKHGGVTVEHCAQVIDGLQKELAAAKAENNALRAAAHPYFVALDVISRHAASESTEEKPSVALVWASQTEIGRNTKQEKLKKNDIALTRQQQEKKYDSYVRSLVRKYNERSSRVYKQVVAPAIGQLKMSVRGNVPKVEKERKDSSAEAPLPTKGSEYMEIMQLLDVAFAGLDAADRGPSQSAAAASSPAKGSPGATGCIGGGEGGGGRKLGNHVSLDLLTLLTAYLEDELAV
jgi:hypothetical protein